MGEISPITARRAPRRTQIVEELRRRIVQGEIPPGERLPSRATLEQDFSASSITVQQAFNVLAHEGFVLSQPNKGTFVAEKPPHLARYGVVLCPDAVGLYGPFTAVLNRELDAIARARNCRFAFYNNITTRPDTIEYQELLRDIKSHRVAGLLFRSDVLDPDFLDTPFVTAPGIPRVVLSGDPRDAGKRHNLTLMGCDDCTFLDRSLDYLLERGRHRVALLESWAFVQDEVADFLLRIGRRKMDTRSQWIHDELSGKGARKVTELLMSLPPSERPDAILMTHEMLIEPVSAGILASGVKAGVDVDVVAYSNLPAIGPTLIPLRRLGVDMCDRIRTALELLDRQRRGEAVPPSVILPLRFEDEMPAAAKAGTFSGQNLCVPRGRRSSPAAECKKGNRKKRKEVVHVS